MPDTLRRRIYLQRKLNIMRKFINSIKTGDLIHYCPIDLKESSHDIGIIYEIIESNIRKYRIYWSRSQIHDLYSETTIERKLKQMNNGKKIMYLIKQND
jgi:hypothetical protein